MTLWQSTWSGDNNYYRLHSECRLMQLYRPGNGPFPFPQNVSLHVLPNVHRDDRGYPNTIVAISNGFIQNQTTLVGPRTDDGLPSGEMRPLN